MNCRRSGWVAALLMILIRLFGARPFRAPLIFPSLIVRRRSWPTRELGTANSRPHF